jgi:hypothetical protein
MKIMHGSVEDPSSALVIYPGLFMMLDGVSVTKYVKCR